MRQTVRAARWGCLQMKTERSGRPHVVARTSPSTPEAADGRRPPHRRVIATRLIVVAVAILLFLSRHAVAGLLLTRGVDLLTKYRVTTGEFHLGTTRSVFDDVRVTTRAGDPLIAARRIGLQYSLRSLWPDKTHRFGIVSVSLEGPVLSIVRHADGSYNLGVSGSGAPASGGGAATPGATAPWNLSVRVRDGRIRLLDRAPVAGDLGEQQIVDVRLDARIQTDHRSTARGSAQFLGRQTQTGALRAWPLTFGGTIDVPRGAALGHVDAPGLPIRGAIAYLQHSPAVRVDDGLLRDVAIHVYSLDIAGARPYTLHVGGSGDLMHGRLAISALRLPVRDVRGRVRLVDGGVWAPHLDASLAEIPIVARGGGYDRFHPTLRLGLRADGNLHRLRDAFNFSASQPVSGGAHVETLIEAPVSSILVRSELRVARGTYGAARLTDVSGRVDYHAGAIVLDAVKATFGATAIDAGARFVLGRPLDSAIVAVGHARGSAIPFGENIAPDAAIEALALITGGGQGYRTRGAVGIRGPAIAGAGMFAVDEQGRGEFGPFAIRRADGSSVIGALRLERPTSQSAAWISTRHYRFDVPARGARFPGLNVPAFPPVAGVIDGELAGGGKPSGFALVGDLRGRGLRVGNARLGTGRTLLSGNLADVRLAQVALNGPLGRFTGNAAVARGTVALRGTYEGSMERLVPLTGNQDARGAVRGEVLATLGASAVVVQSTRAALRGGSLRGVALDTASGTIALKNERFHLLVGSGTVAGRHVVAAESQGTIAVSASDIPAAALRGTGLPLDGGNVSAYGLADLAGGLPGFAGTVTVAGGRAHGYPIAGDAEIALTGHNARILSATGALGSTYGRLGGSIAGIGAGVPRYDVDARVPVGDVDVLRRDLHLPVRHLAGSFGADLHVHGSGSRPFVDGRVEAPEGMYNGLAFRAAAAHVTLDADGVAAHNGTLTVGSTKTALDASSGRSGFRVHAHSAAADLADFNDYFDASGTLAGRGAFDLAFGTDGARITTRGRLNMQHVRYRNLALGQTNAAWRTAGGTITGSGQVRSKAGSLDVSATVQPVAAEDPRRALRGARYDATATFGQIDLGTWLPAMRALGWSARIPSDAPILGSVDAQIGVAGRLPQLAVRADATLTNGMVGSFAVPSAHLRGSSVGSRVAVAAAEADLGFAHVSGDGRLGLARTDPLAFDLRIATDDISGAARRFVPAARGLDLGGALDADLRLGGTPARPTVQGGFDLRGARYGSVVVPRTIGELALAGTAIELRAVDVEFAHGQAFVAGSLPLVLEPFGLGPPKAPLSFDVTATGVDLAQFAPLLPAGAKLDGTINGRFGVEGTVDRPRLLGSLAVSDGSYASALERAPIEHVGAKLDFSGSSIALQAFHANVGGGTLDGSGRITLPLGAQSRVTYTADVTAHGAKLDFPAYGRGTLDGDLHLGSEAGGSQALLSGDVALRDAVIPVSAVYGAGSSTSTPAVKRLGIDPAFRIHAAAGENVRVRSSIVDIGVTGTVDLTGSLRAPQLAGGFDATDGTISSYNHVFRIVKAGVHFNPADGVIPTIEARATSRVTNPDPDPSRNIAGSANIIVTVSGTADSNNLQVTYSSDPAYSQEQIIGLLLDVPALLGAVNFNLNGGAGSPVLRGAPGETNALLPPGVTPEQVSAISFNQEVFSLLNGQFTQRALTPVERVFEKTLGLSDVQFTVDYGGGIGYALRRQIGKRDFQAFLSQTVTYPERTNVGFELNPKPFQSVNFSYYEQNGITSLITNQTPGQELFSSTRRLTSVQPLGNRSGVSLNFNRRF
jgi:hypothetical protein